MRVGQVVGTAGERAEDLAVGETETYTLQGSLTQPTWSTVSVTITRVSENVDGLPRAFLPLSALS